VTAWLVRWRLALRIARRDALRHKGRTLLVIAMVGLPVMAVVAADTLNRTNDVNPVEALPSRLGTADVRIEGASRDPVYADPATGDVYATKDAADPAWTREEVADALPAGSRIVQSETGRITYRTGLGYAPVTGIADDLTDPMRTGAATLIEGRLPTAGDEVAVSPTIARRGFGVGDELELTTGAVRVRIVGVVTVGEQAGGPVVVLPPADADLLQSPGAVFYATVPGGLDWPAVHELNEAGLVAVSRPVVLDPPPTSAWLPPQYGSGPSISSTTAAVLALVVVSVVLEIVLLAGPAFAVGVRRQRRDLALVAAAGGNPSDLRRLVLAVGVLLGGSAAVLGAVLGVGAARAAVPILGRLRNASFGPFDVSPLVVALVVLVGVVAGLVAAYVPARQAARTDVVSTLAGRRGQVRTSWRSPVAGLVLFAAGIGAVVLGARGNEVGVAGGAVLLVVGVVTAAPWLVGLLAPLARRLPTSGRLAVRDATRNRSRTAPAVAAVMATVAGVTALAIGSTSDSAQSRRDYLPQTPMGMATLQGDMDEQTWTGVADMLAAQAPGRDVHRLRAVRFSGTDAATAAITRAGCTGSAGECQWYPEGLDPRSSTGPDLVVADAATVRAVYPEPVAARMAAAVDSGRVAVLGDGAVGPDGSVQVSVVRYDDRGNASHVTSVSLPATRVAAPRDVPLAMASPVIPPVLADRLPVEFATTQLLIGGPGHPVTPAEQQRMTEILTAQAPASHLYVERGWTDGLATPRLILAGLGALLVLIATFTATGLALADARPDFATLVAVGAAPRTRRFVAMGSAAVVGGLGAVLGVLVGFAPGIAVTWPLTAHAGYGTDTAGPVIVIPWLLLAGVTIAVPVLAVAVTGLAVRSRLPMVSRVG
jgi:putative ABC transport system permease protein